MNVCLLVLSSYKDDLLLSLLAIVSMVRILNTIQQSR